MSTFATRDSRFARRSIRILSSSLAVGALVAGTVAATTTSADAAKDRTWNRLAQCESGGRWHINSTYDGGLQFSPSTWRAYGGGRFASYAHQAKRWEQIFIAERTLRSQGWGAWPACSASLGLSHADAAAKWEGRPHKKKIKAFSLNGQGSAKRKIQPMSGFKAETARVKSLGRFSR